jgi:hypothetical protein
MILKKILRHIWRKKLALLGEIEGYFGEEVIITWFLRKKRHLFRSKLAKIAENYDHNIGPRV